MAQKEICLEAKRTGGAGTMRIEVGPRLTNMEHSALRGSHQTVRGGWMQSLPIVTHSNVRNLHIRKSSSWIPYVSPSNYAYCPNSALCGE